MYPQALSRVLAVQPLLDAPGRDQAGPRAAFEHLRIGQTVAARVVGHSRDMTLVSIEGQPVAMRLPRPAEHGETLRLTFAGRLPQPVFMLEAEGAAPADAPELSPTARMLSEIMQRVPERTPPTLTPPAPLLAQPAAGSAELALALRTALVRSGLFYESHLASWVAGQDSLDGLLREPQNRLAAEAAASTTALAETGPKSTHPLHTLLTQQLQVLESPQFVWRGELWPGQPLEWELRRDTDQGDGESAAPGAPAAEPAWESRLKLDLPSLGAIEVHIRLDGRQAFDIRIEPAEADSLARLQAGRDALARQLDAAGCTLHALAVTHHAAA
ncbi:MAG: flagellar hook-length control protein FliK [Pseudomonadota bacterium]